MTVHEKPITHFGWTGSGYIVTDNDNDTGAGAYKISGGSNGEILLIVLGMAMFCLALSLSPSPAGLMLLVGALLLVGYGLSMLFGDARYFTVYSGIAAGLIGALLSAAGAGAIIAWAIPASLELSFTIDNTGAQCAQDRGHPNLFVDLLKIAPKQLQALQAELEATKAKLEAEDFDGITRHELTGNLMQTGILSYFGITNALDKEAAMILDSVTYRQPSYGTYGVVGSVSYWFGLPRNIAFNGFGMDVDRLSFSSEVKNNCHGDWVLLNQASSSRASAFEHIVPEQLLKPEHGNAEGGISAVKALAVAAQKNQKIYTLDLTKIDQLSNISIDSEAKNEIRNALYQGKVVTADIPHQERVSKFNYFI